MLTVRCLSRLAMLINYSAFLYKPLLLNSFIFEELFYM
jgi:hypothetical protein